MSGFYLKKGSLKDDLTNFKTLKFFHSNLMVSIMANNRPTGTNLKNDIPYIECFKIFIRKKLVFEGEFWLFESCFCDFYCKADYLGASVPPLFDTLLSH